MALNLIIRNEGTKAHGVLELWLYRSAPPTTSCSTLDKGLHPHEHQFPLHKSGVVPIMALWKPIWPASMRMQVWSLASLSGLRTQHCHELWCRSTNLVLLWQWHRPEAIVPIQPPAWEPPYAVGAALKKRMGRRRIRVEARFFFQ